MNLRDFSPDEIKPVTNINDFSPEEVAPAQSPMNIKDFAPDEITPIKLPDSVKPVTIPENPPTPIADVLAAAGNAISNYMKPAAPTDDLGIGERMAAQQPPNFIPTREPALTSDPSAPQEYQQATPTEINLQAAKNAAANMAASAPTAAAELAEGAGSYGIDVAQNLAKLVGGPNSSLINTPAEIAKNIFSNVTENTRQYYTGEKNQRPIGAEANMAELPESRMTRQQVEDYIAKNQQTLSDSAKEVLRAKAQPETVTQAVEKSITNTPGAKGILQSTEGLVKFVATAPVDAFKTVRIALADSGLIDASASDEELKQEIIKNPMGVFGRIAASALMGYGAGKKAYDVASKPKVMEQTPVEVSDSAAASEQNMRDTITRSADYQATNERNPELTQAQTAATKYENQGITKEGQAQAKARKANVVVPESGNYYPEIRDNNLTTKDEVVGYYKARGENINREEAARRMYISWPDQKELEVSRGNISNQPTSRAASAAFNQPEDINAATQQPNNQQATTDFLTGKSDQAQNVSAGSNNIPAKMSENKQMPTTEQAPAQNAQQTEAVSKMNENTSLKEPWQMTKIEYGLNEAQRLKGTDSIRGYRPDKLKFEHEKIIERALSEGKPVPPEVLADYPDLNIKKSQTSPEPLKSVKTSEGINTPPAAPAPASEAGNVVPAENKTAPTSGRIGMLGAGSLQNIYDALKNRVSRNAKNAKLEKYLNDNLDPTLRENIKAAEGIDHPSIFKSVIEAVGRIKNEATRHFPDLDEKKYPELANDLRVFEDAGDRAKAKAYYLTKEAVKGLNDTEYSIFRDNIVLSDLKRGVETGLYTNDLPFGFDKKSLDDHLSKVDPAEIAKNPELAESAKKIKDAITRRNDIMNELKSEAVKYKLLRPEVMNDDRYFHHQVLEYMNMNDNTSPGVSPSDVRVGGPKGYRRARVGSLKDFNTEYAQAEWEVTSQMLKDIETAATLQKIKKLDITPQLKAAAAKQGLPKTADVLQKLAPEGYTTWQPEKGNRLFKAFTIPERIVDEILKKNDVVDVGMDDITEQKIIGTPKETWVIPEDVVKTLDNLREHESTPALVEKIAQPLNSSWKVLQLLSPSRATNYMFTNLIGDADALGAYAPKAFTKLPQAIAELWKNDRLNNKTLEDAYNHSVIGTGMTAKEITDVNFAELVKGLKATDYLNPVTLGKKYFEKIAAINNFRENALRYAVFKDFKERLDAGEKNIYGASDRSAIDAIKDNTEKAAKLGRDLMGDYGNVSAQGEYLAKNWIPFYRWMEINTPRYYRMLKNAPFEGGYEGALKSGSKVFKRFLQMNALGTILYQIYHRSLGAATGEDELQKAHDISKARNQLHTVIPNFLFGNDLKDKVRTLRAQGAFSDVTDMIFGTSDLFGDMMDVATNRTTFKEKAKELGWKIDNPADIFNIPFIRKYTMAASPIARTVAEVSLGKAFGKNWGESRPIRDPYQHLARALTAGTAYDIASDTPKEASGPADLVTYKTDLGEIAYNEMMQKKREFLDAKGVGMSTMNNTPAGNAYYNLRRAYRYDRKKIPEYMKEFNTERAKLGQKNKSYSEVENQMREGADPRKFQKPALRDEFYKTLSKEDRRKWLEALKWYKNLYGVE